MDTERARTQQDISQSESADSARFEALPALISIPRAAEILGLSRASAYRYAAAGELPVKGFGCRVYIVTSRLQQLLRDEVA